jgi:hypothetical protein
VLYRYVIANQRYAANITDFEPLKWRPDKASALSDVAAYKRGQRVTVYYDPSNPLEASLERGRPATPIFLCIAASLSVLLAYFIARFVVHGFLKQISPRRADRWIDERSDEFH